MMEIWQLYIFYSLLLSVLQIDCDAKMMCIRKFHTIQNGLFFQRIEVPSPLGCAERCIDNIEHCKAALFIPEENKNRGFCQLYGANSNSSDHGITLDSSLNPRSTVFEILDNCPKKNGSTSSESDLMAMIKLELKQKLESWSDPESPPLLLPPRTVQRSKNDGSTKKRTSNDTSDDEKKLSRKGRFDKFDQGEYRGWPVNVGERSENSNYGPITPVINGLVSMAQGVSNPSSSSYINKRLPFANHYPSTLLQNFNTNNNYLPKQGYSLPTNGIPLPPPIKPVSVNHGRQETIYNRCRGSNCYAPSLAYLQKLGYNWSCPTYSFLCEPKRLDPCFTACPQVTIASLNSIPKTTLLNEEWSGSYINKQQQFNEPEQNKELLQPQDVSHGPIQSLSTPVQPTESMIISWSEWSPKTPCSVTCGIGVTAQKRFCSVDGQCSGESVKEELCSNGPCPEWRPWSEWTKCSRSCDGGERSRSRICSVDHQCDGPSVSIEACNVEKCAQWSMWGNWEVCSVTCGTGQQIRQRQCVSGNGCIGESFEKKTCEQPLCPSWSTWESWSTCSVSCGNGHRHRTRICYGRNNCIGDTEEHEVCSRNSCPEWTVWSSWTQCTETCGTKGNKLRVRTCIKDNLRSSLCDGAAQDQMACKDLPECPSWISWSSWSICSATCGHGQQNRQRSCHPTSMKCAGAEREFRFCQESVCPYWDEWSSWSTCSVTCGSGTRERRRKCMKDYVTKNITKEGSSLEDVTKNAASTKSIKQEVIPLYKSELAAAGQHDIRMANNITSTVSFDDRNLPVTRIIQENNSCNGNAIDRERCDEGLCCKLSEWTMWTACSVSCGGGTRERYRICSSQDRSQSYESGRFPYYSKVAGKQIPVEADMRHGPAVFGHDGRSNYERQGLQPIVPLRENLMRVSRRAANVHNFGLYEEDNFVRRLDESLCRCDDRELREENNCAQIPCPEISNARNCGWSQWTEWCDCIGLCNQGNRIRTRYCVDGIPASDDTSNSNIEHDPCILPECSIRQESRVPITEQNIALRQYPTRPDSRNPSQYNCRQIVSTIKRDIEMGCLWSSWNSENTCAGGFKTRTRSCIGMSSAKIRCHCDDKLMEQIECFCPRMEVIRSNQSVDATTKFTPQSSAMTPRGTAIAEERMTAYRRNSSMSSCSWSQWGIWSACSETCGAGKTVRKRSCPCRSCSFGEASEVQSCELMSC